MKIKYFGYIILAFFATCFVTSCGDDNEYTYDEEPLTKNALIKSFSVTGSAIDGVDSVAYAAMEKTVFSIDQRNSIIYNSDSLPYKTRLAKFLPKIGLMSESGATIKVVYRDTTVVWKSDSNDSIDFSKEVVLRVIPAAGEGAQKEYQVKFNIHQYDPDTLGWMRLTSLPIAANVPVKAVAVNDKIVVYAAIGNQIKMYTSPRSNVAWSEVTITTLPQNVRLSSITLFGEKLLAVTADRKSYSASASSPEAWNVVNNGMNIHNILGVLPAESEDKDKLLVMVEEAGAYKVGETTDLTSITLLTEIIGFATPELPIDDRFPSHDFTSATKYNRASQSDNMMVVAGGVDFDGEISADVWMFKLDRNGKLEVSPFKYSQSNKLFEVSNDFKAFAYDNKIYAATNDTLYTSQWGMKWAIAPNKQQFTSAISTSKNQSIAIDSDQFIWIVGSENQAGRVWKGRLNRLSK